MEPREKEELLDRLRGGRRELLDVLNGVTEEAAARRPGGGKWSILECIEHLVVAEDYLYLQIAAARPGGGPQLSREREGRIVSRGLDRSTPVASPEVGLPSGRFATLAEGVERFLASRERTLRFVENCEEDLRAQFTTHPMIPGRTNCYEMLLMMAVHPLRHSRQIAEIRAAEDGNPISH